uniref:THD domain-containing protein n=1 Tax=Myripristis murdjan TaxID=586833 RepID=A0A667WYB8_9TELE
MLYNALLSLTAFMFCLSLFLVYRASVLENDFRKLQGDIILQLNQPRSEGVSDERMGKMSKTREDIKPSTFQQTQKSSLKLPFKRVKREQGGCRGGALSVESFLQLTANDNNQPYVKGNVTLIPWTVAVQHGHAISPKENKIVVQEDGYYMVFGQVLFKTPGTFMGHTVRRWSPSTLGTGSIEILRCVQEMFEAKSDNTCYTAGIVKLNREDELELVLPDRLQNLISVDEDSTFFGVIQLN